jgi:hypothetical protein
VANLDPAAGWCRKVVVREVYKDVSNTEMMKPVVVVTRYQAMLINIFRKASHHIMTN